MKVIKWCLLLWLGVFMGLLVSPFLLTFYVGKGAVLGVKATWIHMSHYMGQVKHDCVEGMRRKF